MPRTTNAPASRERRKRVIQKAKGYRGRRSKLFRYAKDATMKGQYWSYRDRKTRKRNFRNLWIVRINAAVRTFDLTYSRFIEALTKAYRQSDQVLLGSATVPSGTVGTLIDTFRLESVSPFSLAPDTYVIVMTMPAGTSDLQVANATSFTFASEITYITSAFGDGSALGFPN